MLRRRLLMAQQGDRIPDDFIPVSYLKTKGHQHINTGLTLKTGISIEATFLIGGGYVNIMGCRGSGSENHVAFSSTSDIEAQYNNSYWKDYVARGKGRGEKVTAFAGPDKRYIKDEKTQEILGENAKINTDIFTAEYPILLCNVGGIPVSGRTGLIGNIYNAKVYQNGIIVRNFMPVLRKADSKPGMYDTVERKFYINSGSGEFDWEV